MSAKSSPSSRRQSARRKQLRSVVLAVADSDASQNAVEYACREVYREGDVFNLVHVLKCEDPETEVYHGVPTTSYEVHVSNQETKDTVAIAKAKDMVQRRFTDAMDDDNIPHSLHLYLDTINAPASAVTKTINKVVASTGAALVILASHSQRPTDTIADRVLIGSVADYCCTYCDVPVMLIPPPKGPEDAEDEEEGGLADEEAEELTYKLETIMGPL